MTIRIKILVVIILTLSGLALSLKLILQKYLLHNFDMTESHYVLSDMNDFMKILEMKVGDLDVYAADWAQWDDTYRFVQDQNAAYRESNLQDTAFRSGKLNLAIFVNDQGRVVFSKAYDYRHDKKMDVPSIFLQGPDFDALVHHVAADSDKKGILLSGKDIYLISSRPVLKSDLSGPMKGTLIFGRIFDDEQRRALEEIVGQRLSFLPVAGASDLIVSESNPQAVVPLSERVIKGFSLIKDILGRPVLVAQLEGDRAIHLYGKETQRFLFLLLFICVFAFGIANLIFLERAVLSKITSLGGDFLEIQKTGDLSHRVVVEGRDEIAHFSQGVNRTLESLEKSKKDLIASKVELERSNRDLEQFGHVISHDLREPLRKILSFGDLLKHRYAGVLEDQGKDYLERMQKAAQRMDDLIASLLKYARVSREARPNEVVDLHLTVEEVLSDLEPRIVDSKARVDVGALPQVKGDRVLLRQLFQNLIANALKFSKKGETPHVSVSLVERRDNRVTIKVEDQGIGFDPQYAKKIFEPFRRLHTREEYEGTGIGLAICQKIVEAHGGKIQADGEPGKGARFLITLPVS